MSNSTPNLTDLIENNSSESEGIDVDALDASTQLALLRAERYKSNTQSRKWLAEWAAVIVTLWLTAVVIILCNNSSKKIGLSDTVLSVLLGTTTLNILGLMFIVLKGYFSGNEKMD